MHFFRAAENTLISAKTSFNLPIFFNTNAIKTYPFRHLINSICRYGTFSVIVTDSLKENTYE